jgi:hypothetical protein
MAGGWSEPAGEAEEGAAISSDDTPPSHAGDRRADEPERGVESEEYQIQQVIRDVVDAGREGLMILLPYHQCAVAI